MVTSIELSGDYGIDDVDRLCAGLAPLHTLPPGSLLRLDLSRTRSVSPAGLAILLSTLDSTGRRGVCADLDYAPPQGPSSPSPCLSPQTIGRLISAPRRFGSPETSICPGCERFTASDQITRAIKTLQNGLAQRFELEEAALGAAAWMLSDLAENVLQHAEIHVGVATAAAYPNTGELEMAVADCGIGIRASLAKNPDHADVAGDVEAIRRSLQPGATGDPGVGGGDGLFLTHRVVKEVGGTLVVHSGEGRAHLSEDPASTGACTELKGTLVAIRARTDHALDFERIDTMLKRRRGATRHGG